ncbi:MAG: amidohydrolase family protein, partial [Gemmatimonadota bacterium]
GDTVQGSHTHRRVDRPGGDLPDQVNDATPPYKARSITLSSNRLGLIAKLDVLEGEGEQVTPVDYKKGKRPHAAKGAYLPERVQLCVQGMLLEESGYKCDEGVLYFAGSKERVKVPFDDELRERTLSAVNGLRFMAAGGRASQANLTAPRLYLASGVTTIRTTGSRRPYDDINVRSDIEAGRAPGPRIHITAPYITGTDGTTSMAQIGSPEQARRFVAYWAAEGAQWIKAYTAITREDLAAAIDEAHEQGIKVTGHICSVSFREAVELGIDNIEHGFATASDFIESKQPDECPSNLLVRVGDADPRGETAQDVIRTMVDGNVPMTSTLAVYEPFIRGRPTKDSLTLAMMAPEVREDYLAAREQIDSDPDHPLTNDDFLKAMEFEKAFVEAGGVLAAGVDPTGLGGAIAGFGDQRNYQLLHEAGFTPSQVIQIMSLHGAKVLGVDDELGSVEPGKVADLAVMEGDLASDPGAIRRVHLVFKDGVGYDSERLIESVKGRVGIN